MKYIKLNLFIFILLLFFLVDCKKNDSLSSVEKNIVSETGEVSFEELLILLNLKITDSTYLVVQSIDSVKIYINNYYWAKVSSQILDISKVDKTLDGNKYQSKQKINYLLIAQQDIKASVFTTAGEYAQYLNANYELKPGEYVCLIESFYVTFNDNTIKKYYPFVYKSFKVEQDSRSAFAGEIELKID